MTLNQGARDAELCQRSEQLGREGRQRDEAEVLRREQTREYGCDNDTGEPARDLGKREPDNARLDLSSQCPGSLSGSANLPSPRAAAPERS